MQPFAVAKRGRGSVIADGTEAANQRLTAVVEDAAHFVGVVAIEVAGAFHGCIVSSAERVAVDGGVDGDGVEWFATA